MVRHFERYIIYLYYVEHNDLLCNVHTLYHLNGLILCSLLKNNTVTIKFQLCIKDRYSMYVTLSL